LIDERGLVQCSIQEKKKTKAARRSVHRPKEEREKVVTRDEKKKKCNAAKEKQIKQITVENPRIEQKKKNRDSDTTKRNK